MWYYCLNRESNTTMMGLKENIVYQGINVKLAKSKRDTLSSFISSCVLKSFVWILQNFCFQNSLNSNQKYLFILKVTPFFILMKYSWHAILYSFQVYNWHLYVLWIDHHITSNNHLSLCKVIILFTVFPMLYITSFKKWLPGEFPGGPEVVRTLSSHC